jgi:hypothetical protein
MNKWLCIFFLLSASMSPSFGNDSLRKVSVKGFLEFIKKDQAKVVNGGLSNPLYTFDGLKSPGLDDSLYINGGELNPIFSNSEKNYTDARNLIKTINEDGDDTFIYVFKGRYFFQKEGFPKGLDANEWDSYMNVAKIKNASPSISQNKKFSNIICEEIREKVQKDYPSKKILIICIFEEFTASSKNKTNLYTDDNTVGSLSNGNFYYKDFKIGWSYINFNSLEKGVIKQNTKALKPLEINPQTGSASQEEYGRIFLESVTNKINGLKEVKTVLYPDLPLRERLYAHLLKKNAFDPTKVAGFEELKPDGFMYNYNAAYNAYRKSYPKSPEGVWKSYYFEKKLQTGVLLADYVKNNGDKFDATNVTVREYLGNHFFRSLEMNDNSKSVKRKVLSKTFFYAVALDTYLSSPLKEKLRTKVDAQIAAFEAYKGDDDYKLNLSQTKNSILEARTLSPLVLTPPVSVTPSTPSGGSGGFVIILTALELSKVFIDELFSSGQELMILKASYEILEVLKEASDVVDFDAVNASLKEKEITPDEANLSNVENKIRNGQTVTDAEWQAFATAICNIKLICRDWTIWKTLAQTPQIALGIDGTSFSPFIYYLKPFSDRLNLVKHHEWRYLYFNLEQFKDLDFKDVLKFVLDKTVNNGGTIHFNLDGFDIKRARTQSRSTTDYEFNLIIDTPSYLNKTKFYRNFLQISTSDILNELK